MLIAGVHQVERLVPYKAECFTMNTLKSTATTETF